MSGASIWSLRPATISKPDVFPPYRFSLRLIVFDHGSDMDDDPSRFRTTITFDEQSDGKTVVTLRQMHPTKAQRDFKIGFALSSMAIRRSISSRHMSKRGQADGCFVQTSAYDARQYVRRAPKRP